jgi:hypothetical protein
MFGLFYCRVAVEIASTEDAIHRFQMAAASVSGDVSISPAVRLPLSSRRVYATGLP